MEVLHGSVALVAGARYGTGRAVAISLPEACAWVVPNDLDGDITEQMPVQTLAPTLRNNLCGLKSSDSCFAWSPV